MSAVDYCICIEELARVDPGVALSVAAHNGLCSAHIGLFGTEEQKQTYLTPLARGEKIGAWGLTESTSGSDAAGMRTTATRAGDCWVLNGSKTFITHGRVGDVMVVDGGHRSRRGHQAASPRSSSSTARPGMTAGKKEDKLGMRASDTSEVLFENCRIPATQLLGEEGHGFVNTHAGARRRPHRHRRAVGRPRAGRLRGGAAATRKERRAVRQDRSARFQAIQWKLADTATRIEAARLLTYRAAYLKDRGRRTTLESAMAKLYASEIAVSAADDCVQIHGGYGFVKDYPAEKYFRDVKLTTIGEGTSEIQRLVIARQLLAAMTATPPTRRCRARARRRSARDRARHLA